MFVGVCLRWLIECRADILARWKSSDGCDRTVVAAITATARSYSTTAA